jgi:hypothetical protein
MSVEAISKHEKLTRALCAEEEDIRYIAHRRWRQLSFSKPSYAKEIIERHLMHYGEIQEVIADEIVANCLEYLTQEENPLEEKKKVIKRLLVMTEILGKGFSK